VWQALRHQQTTYAAYKYSLQWTAIPLSAGLLLCCTSLLHRDRRSYGVWNLSTVSHRISWNVVDGFLTFGHGVHLCTGNGYVSGVVLQNRAFVAVPLRYLLLWAEPKLGLLKFSEQHYNKNLYGLLSYLRIWKFTVTFEWPWRLGSLNKIKFGILKAFGAYCTKSAELIKLSLDWRLWCALTF